MDIVNYTRRVWEHVFGDNNQSPVTFFYDAQSMHSGTLAGLCHIAHDYIDFESNPSPDDNIYSYQSGFQNSIEHLKDIEELPLLDCIILASISSPEDVEVIMEHASERSVIIVINDCVVIDKWDELNQLSCNVTETRNLQSLKAFSRSEKT